MNQEFIIERGVDIYEKPRKNRSGKWKELALNMAAPREVDGVMVYDSVAKSANGNGLTLKQAIALVNALSRLGYKAVTRRNGNGYRVWRTV